MLAPERGHEARGGRKPQFAHGQPRYDRPMLSLLYLVVRALVRLLVSAGQPGRADGSKDLEILVLRHQLRVLQRRRRVAVGCECCLTIAASRSARRSPNTSGSASLSEPRSGSRPTSKPQLPERLGAAFRLRRVGEQFSRSGMRPIAGHGPDVARLCRGEGGDHLADEACDRLGGASVDVPIGRELREDGTTESAARDGAD